VLIVYGVMPVDVDHMGVYGYVIVNRYNLTESWVP
jgi:hypothetical protein